MQDTQLEGTVHVQVGRGLNALLHNIFDHTAHHLLPTIPLYRLPAAQAAVETAFPSRVIVERLTIKRFLRIVRTCELYDPKARRWMRFKDAGQYGRTACGPAEITPP